MCMIDGWDVCGFKYWMWIVVMDMDISKAMIYRMVIGILYYYYRAMKRQGTARHRRLNSPLQSQDSLGNRWNSRIREATSLEAHNLLTIEHAVIWLFSIT